MDFSWFARSIVLIKFLDIDDIGFKWRIDSKKYGE
jgi:hypothetical protein